MKSRPRSSPAQLTLHADDIHGFRRRLLAWFSKQARQLPWRTTPRDPYAVWISEVMLQQTRVATVVPYFNTFMDRFPNVSALAQADLDDVLSAWSGLGYYRRARLMHAAARQMLEAHQTVLPGDYDSLLKLSGIGQYTAAAIASMAFEQRVAVVDGNVLRVLARMLADSAPIDVASTHKRIRNHADKLVDPDNPGGFNEAMMELGATVCTPTSPTCLTCPVRKYCRGHARGRVSDLPVVTPKKKSKKMQLEAFVLTREGLVWMCRRREEGLFGGMWEPPMVQAEERIYGKALQRVILGRSRRLKGKLEHVLTHRIIQVRVIRWDVEQASELPMASSYDRGRWMQAGQGTGMGISSLASRVLDYAGVKGGMVGTT
ncbi:MAG: A/G-specific adenine glycosylase [Sorangium cellulosum]|nr:MAG: A/G-specific adenine glycosylase [Sorangium cellulosum]